MRTLPLPQRKYFSLWCSMNRKLLAFLLTTVLNGAMAADFEMVSLRHSTDLPPTNFYGGGGGGSGAQPAITPDGRYVVFTGSTSGIDPLVPNPGDSDQVFLRDRLTDTTEMISRGYDGSSPGDNSGGNFLSISNDGCRVVFDSTASNLVQGDTNVNYSDGKNIFVRYRCGPKAGSTDMVDVDPTGQPLRVGYGDYGYISPDGRKVAFYFSKGGIVSGLKDKNNYDCEGALYIRDLDTGTTSAPSYSGYCVGGAGPALSYDGSRMAFWSGGTTNPMPNPIDNGVWQIWVYDANSGRFSVASSNAAGQAQRRIYSETNCAGEGFSTVTIPAISSDGHHVAFRSRGAGLTSLDSCSGISQLYAKNIDTGEIVMASVNSLGQPGNADSSGGGAGYRPGSVTSGGRYVVFSTLATNLVTGESGSGESKVAVRDLWNGTTTGPVFAGENLFSWPAMSLSGRYIAVYSGADLDPRFPTGPNGYFLQDRGTPMPPVATSLASRGGSITLYFTPGDPGLSSIIEYKAQCAGKNGSSGTATGTVSPLTVTGLKGSLTYWCSVSASNSLGSSDASNALVRKGASIVPLLGLLLD